LSPPFFRHITSPNFLLSPHSGTVRPPPPLFLWAGLKGPLLRAYRLSGHPFFPSGPFARGLILPLPPASSFYWNFDSYFNEELTLLLDARFLLGTSFPKPHFIPMPEPPFLSYVGGGVLPPREARPETFFPFPREGLVICSFAPTRRRCLFCISFFRSPLRLFFPSLSLLPQLL